jgi:hypothetical protein
MRPGTSDDPSTAAAYVAAQKIAKENNKHIHDDKPNLQFRRRSSTMRPGTSDDPSTAAAYVAAQKNSKRK